MKIITTFLTTLAVFLPKGILADIQSLRGPVDVGDQVRHLQEPDVSPLGACYSRKNCRGVLTVFGNNVVWMMTKKACMDINQKSWREGGFSSDEECCNLDGTVYGDPHFQTWSGEKYDYHGQCDLVLIHNPGFADGLGMDIHIRTKIHNDWSAVESAAIRIGEDVLEVSGEGGYWLNGEPNVQFPALLAGRHVISMREPGPNTRRFSIGIGHNQKVRITQFKDFLAVNIDNPLHEDFDGSLGLLGAFGSGYRVGRNGKTIVEDWNAFGQEWQVLATEPKLFHVNDSPQHPQQCQLPSKVKDVSRRRLSGLVYTEAEEACGHVEGTEYKDCIFDVLATGDVEMAGAY